MGSQDTPTHDLVIIARDASFYDWLIGAGRRDAPPTLPPHLYADFGLPRPSSEPLRHEWRGPRRRDG